MSMWLALVKIDPAMLSAVRERPELTGALFFEDDVPEPLVSGVHPTGDCFHYDYRLLSDMAEGRSEAEEGTPKWHTAYPWLARATGENCSTVEGSELGYGPAHFLTPHEVGQVAAGLAGEHWTSRASAPHWDAEAEDRDFDDIVPFFARAAAEGKAILGGVY
ncbi:hypothetical protein J2X68_007518 [Streptomyces sp. 3330]|uniref:hypothetical protein n=1 Tax=Streptomyces sp. 3330 TaxID=2817755 RepID=UPI00285C3B00|nr:hypothetical protein [Streptomyces sp. 3330]MDR6980776.1 hypothetical protein [Streptomyces sp. 3330]